MAGENAATDATPEKEVGSPYSDSIRRLGTSLRLVKELNEELQKSIAEIERKRKESVLEKLKKSDKDSLSELFGFIQMVQQRISESTALKKDLDIPWPPSKKVVDFLLEVSSAVITPRSYTNFIRDMSLVYLVAEFESYLQDVLRITLEKEPEILMTSKKSITYEDFFKMKDIDQGKKEIIEKELLSLFNQGIDGVEEYVEQKFNVKLPALPDWKRFKERFYRRNIIVHNSGIVNKIYRSKTGYKGKDIKLQVTEKYLEKSIEMFELTCSKVARLFYEKFACSS